MAFRNFLLRASGLLVMVGLLASTASAQLTQVETAQQLQLNTITTAVPFLMIAPDSRSGAMGDVGVALSPDANSMPVSYTHLTLPTNSGV